MSMTICGVSIAVSASARSSMRDRAALFCRMRGHEREAEEDNKHPQEPHFMTSEETSRHSPRRMRITPGQALSDGSRAAATGVFRPHGRIFS